MNVDKTTENDALEANESYDEGTTTESFSESEEATAPSKEQAEQADSDGDDAITLSRAELDELERAIRKEQDQRWKERIKGLDGEKGGKESSQKSHKEGHEGVASKEELDRFRLETKGIEDKSQQDFILKYAQLEDMSISEALADDVVKAKLEKMTAKSQKDTATQSPINRTGVPAKATPESDWKKWMEKGIVPPTAERRTAARRYGTGRK